MPEKCLLPVLFLMFTITTCLSSSSYAEDSRLVLSTQDLTWLYCTPNEDINKTLATLKKNYKINIHSMAYAGHSSYVAGDPTPAMSWVLKIDKNSRGKLISMEYSRFKESDGGVKIKTNRGIEYGSGIERVYDSYGPGPTIDRTQDPGMRYVNLKYPFVLEETGQEGHLTFILHHKPGDPEETATVIKMRWDIIQYPSGKL